MSDGRIIRVWDTSPEECVSVFGQRYGTICQPKFNIKSASADRELYPFGFLNAKAFYSTPVSPVA